MKIISVEPNYTGGGIYVFSGETEHHYFIADNGFYDVRLLNEDPREPSEDKCFDLKGDSVEWQEEHYVADLEPSSAKEFFKYMLEWVKENKPDGNYQMGDMEYIMEDLEGGE